MNQDRTLVFAVCYGVLAGYLLTPAIGHMLSLWPGPDRHALALRLGAVTWVALILLSAWTGSRLTAAIGAGRDAAVLRGPLHAAILVLGFVTGIVIADSLLALINLVAGPSILASRTQMRILLALVWLAGGMLGAVLLSRLVHKRLTRNSILGSEAD
jgi:hypothetical protein